MTKSANIPFTVGEERAPLEKRIEHLETISGVLAEALESKLMCFERNLQTDDMTLTIEQGEFQQWSAALRQAEVSPRQSGWGVLVGEELLQARLAAERKAGKVEGILKAANHCETSDVQVPVEEWAGTTRRQFSNVVIRHLSTELREMAAQIERGEEKP